MKNQMLAILIIISLCLGFLMACSSSGGGSADSDNQTSADNTTTNLTGPIADLQGTWRTNVCEEVDDDLYENRSLEVSGKNFILTSTQYSDVCITLKAQFKSSFTDLDVGDNVSFTDNMTGYQFTMKWEKQTVTPFDNNTTQWLVDNSVCGVADWQIDSPKDITGKDCGNDAGIFPAKETPYYGAYLLVGDNLYLGAGSDNGSYPTSLETDRIFVKQNSSSQTDKTELEGTWISSCLSDGYVNVLKKIDVSGDSVEFEWTYYDQTDNQTCSTVRDILAFSTDNISITDNSTIKTLSVTNKKWTLTPIGETNDYNAINRCGFSDWQMGVARDVTGISMTDCDFPPAGALFPFQYSLDWSSLDFTDFVDTRTYTKQ